ncbi:MAG: YdcF family protein [Hyphomicrobiaceae bacterium]|nr:YdcF family protein [Hyphomicrobiaceae bacterium]
MRKLVAGLALLSFAFVAGFVVFASSVARPADSPPGKADGIVVVTGGEHRLVEATRLLADGHAGRLLVSGANRQVSREDILRRSGLDPALHPAVDVGYEALDTIGNAEETRDWARARGFRRIIIVTSAYHMPRTLIELQRAMPEATFIPFRVINQKLHAERWWLHRGTARLLLSEYIKTIPSAARWGLASLARRLGAIAVADNPAGTGAPSILNA